MVLSERQVLPLRPEQSQEQQSQSGSKTRYIRKTKTLSVEFWSL